MVDLLFLPRNFGLVVGTYEGLLLLCECTWRVGSMFRWWGHTHPLDARWVKIGQLPESLSSNWF